MSSPMKDNLDTKVNTVVDTADNLGGNFVALNSSSKNDTKAVDAPADPDFQANKGPNRSPSIRSFSPGIHTANRAITGAVSSETILAGPNNQPKLEKKRSWTDKDLVDALHRTYNHNAMLKQWATFKSGGLLESKHQAPTSMPPVFSIVVEPTVPSLTRNYIESAFQVYGNVLSVDPVQIPYPTQAGRIHPSLVRPVLARRYPKEQEWVVTYGSQYEAVLAASYHPWAHSYDPIWGSYIVLPRWLDNDFYTINQQMAILGVLPDY